MKPFSIVAVGAALVSFQAFAQEFVMPEMSYAEFKQSIANRMTQSFDDSFPMLDLDGNGFLSENEANEVVKGRFVLEQVSPAEQEKDLADGRAAFKRFDKDYDNRLNEAEAKMFLSDLALKEADRQFKKMDADKNGALSMQEIAFRGGPVLSPEESMKKMDEAIGKLKTTVENFDGKAFVDNIAAAQAGESFYQADKDKNGALNRAEFYASVREQINSGNPDEKLDLPDSVLAEDFDKTDTNRDGKISKDEFVKAYVDAMNAPVEGL